MWPTDSDNTKPEDLNSSPLISLIGSKSSTTWSGSTPTWKPCWLSVAGTWGLTISRASCSHLATAVTSSPTVSPSSESEALMALTLTGSTQPIAEARQRIVNTSPILSGYAACVPSVLTSSHSLFLLVLFVLEFFGLQRPVAHQASYWSMFTEIQIHER